MSQPLENDLFIRDDVDDNGRLGSGMFAGRSPDIIVLREPSSDPAREFADLADTHEGDLIRQAHAHTIYVRVHNRSAANRDATVKVYWVRPNAARSATDSQAPAFDTSKWTQIGPATNVTVPAQGWAFASVSWASADVPAGSTNPKIVEYVGLVALVSTGPDLDDTGPELSELSDAASFWRFFANLPASNNAAFRAVPFEPPFRFEPPGRTDDLGEPGDPMYEAWHTAMSATMDRAIHDVRIRLNANGGGTCQFVNPADPSTPIGSPSTLLTVTWKGFPMKFLRAHRDDRVAAWHAAEDFPAGQPRKHDEYLEWFTHKNSSGLITRVDFTAEAFDYWEFLYRQASPLADPNSSKIVELYRKYIDPSVTFADLTRSPGLYDIFNRWNTEFGAMHLTNGPNNLFAEVHLAADATVLVKDAAGMPVTDALQLATITRAGAMWRSSDPRINWDVNQLARAGYKITLANPVGLLIDDLDDSGFTTKYDQPAGNYWRVLRGFSGGILRAVYEVPTSEGFVVGEMKIGGRRIEYGGQIAEHITMKLVGQAWDEGGIRNTPVPPSAYPPPAIAPTPPVFGLAPPNPGPVLALGQGSPMRGRS